MAFELPARGQFPRPPCQAFERSIHSHWRRDRGSVTVHHNILRSSERADGVGPISKPTGKGIE